MGHIGHNHARSYQSNPDACLAAVCDRNPERAAAADQLQSNLRDWQDSVLRSLTGADYAK